MSDHADRRITEETYELPNPLIVRITGLEDLQPAYSNLVHVNFDSAAFQVVFSQLLQPVITSSNDAKELADRGYIGAQAVARLILTPQMLEETISILERQLNNFRERDQAPIRANIEMAPAEGLDNA